MPAAAVDENLAPLMDKVTHLDKVAEELKGEVVQLETKTGVVGTPADFPVQDSSEPTLTDDVLFLEDMKVTLSTRIGQLEEHVNGQAAALLQRGGANNVPSDNLRSRIEQLDIDYDELKVRAANTWQLVMG